MNLKVTGEITLDDVSESKLYDIIREEVEKDILENYNLSNELIANALSKLSRAEYLKVIGDTINEKIEYDPDNDKGELSTVQIILDGIKTFLKIIH